MDAGAALIQEDHIRAKFIQDSRLTATEIKAAASAVLYQKVNLSLGVKNSAKKSAIDGYARNQTSSRIYTYGGPPYQADFSVSDWQSRLRDELVSIDRY